MIRNKLQKEQKVKSLSEVSGMPLKVYKARTKKENGLLPAMIILCWVYLNLN